MQATGRHAAAPCVDEVAAARLAAANSSKRRHSFLRFEKTDRVTRTTIRGRFTTALEQVYHRHELVSFALSDAAVAGAREATSGGVHHQIESEEDHDDATAATTAAAADTGTAALAAATAAHTAYTELSRKREEGKRREAARKCARSCRAYALSARPQLGQWSVMPGWSLGGISAGPEHGTWGTWGS